MLEERDGFFTQLRTIIEKTAERCQSPVVIVAHSMGNRVLQYFLHRLVATEGDLGRQWIDRHVHSYVAVGAPFLGAPKIVRSLVRTTAPLSPLLLLSRAITTYVWCVQATGERMGMEALLRQEEGVAFIRSLGTNWLGVTLVVGILGSVELWRLTIAHRPPVIDHTGSTGMIMPMAQPRYFEVPREFVHLRGERSEAHLPITITQTLALAGASVPLRSTCCLHSYTHPAPLSAFNRNKWRIWRRTTVETACGAACRMLRRSSGSLPSTVLLCLALRGDLYRWLVVLPHNALFIQASTWTRRCSTSTDETGRANWCSTGKSRTRPTSRATPCARCAALSLVSVSLVWVWVWVVRVRARA
jgi:hypothetical protein